MRHRRSYRSGWRAARLITTAVFLSWVTRPRTVVVYEVTYYNHDGTWYTQSMHEGETVYVVISTPTGYEVESLPDDALVIEVDGQTYYLSEHTFYTKIQREGKDLYVVVDPPPGAQVSSIPPDAMEHEESGVTVYQYDETFYSKDADDGGNEYYVVEPPPPEEELESVPDDAVTFAVDEETYYYVGYALYVSDEEGGYVTSEPPLGGIAPQLPDGATVIQEGGETFFQLDTVFFQMVETESGTAYEVIPAPDGSEIVDEG